MDNKLILLLSDDRSMRIVTQDPSPVATFIQDLYKRSSILWDILNENYYTVEEYTPIALADAMQKRAGSIVKEVEDREGHADEDQLRAQMLVDAHQLLKDAAAICAFEMGSMLSH